MATKDDFVNLLGQSVRNGVFVSLVLSKYKGGQKDLKNVKIQPVTIKDSLHLSFKYVYKTKDETYNYLSEKGIEKIESLLGKEYFSANLFTLNKDYSLLVSSKGDKFHLTSSASSHKSPAILSHNNIKQGFINGDEKFLKLLGITGTEGLRNSKKSKLRQIERFIEVLAPVIEDSKLAELDRTVKIIDIGSGKSYLTFALYHYLNNILKIDASITGIEQRNDLCKLSQTAAEKCNYTKLNFISGKASETETDKYDMVIALHACDTATDDAIAYGIKSESKIIAVAPCCQKYMRKHFIVPDVLKPIYKHGSLEENLAVSLTDGLRSLVLESFGYKTKVFEFISSEHTGKNLMITAVKSQGKDVNRHKKEISKIKDFFQIQDFYLDNKINLI